MQFLLLFVLLAIGFAVPARLALPWIPGLIVLTNARWLGAVVEFGPIRLMPQDPVLLGAAIKFVLSQLSNPERPLGRAMAGLGVYVLALVPGLVVGWRVFGGAYTGDRVLSLARLTLEAMAIPALALSLRGAADARHVERVLYAVAFLAAGTIYLDRLLYPFGVTLGELQGADTGLVRSFGVAGDQVGFFLAFFFLHATVRRRVVGATFFLVAIALTVGIGAMLTVAAGLAVLAAVAMRTRPEAGTGRRRPTLSLRAGAAVCVAVLVAGYFGAGVLRERLAGGGLFTSGSGLQRTLTAAVAVDIVRLHPIAGVGYLGLLPASVQLGSVAIFREGWEGAEIAEAVVANAGNQYLEALVDGGVIGAVGLLGMLVAFGRLLRAGGQFAPEPARAFLLAGFAWLVGLMAGNQSAVWLLPGSLLAATLYLLVGTAQGMAFPGRAVAARLDHAIGAPAPGGGANRPADRPQPDRGDRPDA